MKKTFVETRGFTARMKGRLTVFEQLRAGLEDSIAYSKGQLSLKTTTLPAPPPKVGSNQIVALRKKLKMSQAVFAATLNVSTKTIQSWEQGAREPSDAALRMIQVVRTQPGVIRLIFARSGGRAGKTAVTTRKPSGGKKARVAGSAC